MVSADFTFLSRLHPPAAIDSPEGFKCQAQARSLPMGSLSNCTVKRRYASPLFCRVPRFSTLTPIDPFASIKPPWRDRRPTRYSVSGRVSRSDRRPLPSRLVSRRRNDRFNRNCGRHALSSLGVNGFVRVLVSIQCQRRTIRGGEAGRGRYAPRHRAQETIEEAKESEKLLLSWYTEMLLQACSCP